MEQQQYFRVAKKIKSSVLAKLKESGQVVEEKTLDMGNSKLVPVGKMVKLLFHGTIEDDSLHMLIGLARYQSLNASEDSQDYDSEVDLDTNQVNKTLASITTRNAEQITKH